MEQRVEAAALVARNALRQEGRIEAVRQLVECIADLEEINARQTAQLAELTAEREQIRHIVANEACVPDFPRKMTLVQALHWWNERELGWLGGHPANGGYIMALVRVAMAAHKWTSPPCCEDHAEQAWQKLAEALQAFEDDSFRTLKGAAERLHADAHSDDKKGGK